MAIKVLKADGLYQDFDVQKLKRSLRRSGATDEETKEVVKRIEAILYDGIRTQEIYRHAFTFLREGQKDIAARYSLRRALFGLGPTGFPFEDFLARLFQTEGYTTKTRVSLVGKCAEHELDIAAYSESDSFVCEAKFHSRPGIKSDLQVVMYSYARLLDLKNQKICQQDVCGIKDFKIVTNTKFTNTAEKYANCVGMSLLSWNYPEGNNLHDLIQRSGLYPVTVLNNLSQSQKLMLISRGAIVCSDLVERPQLLRHLHISKKRTESVLAEAASLCGKK